MDDSDHQDLMALMHQVGLRMRAAMTEVVAEFGLSPQLAWTMRQMASAPQSMGELAEHLCCDASYITGLADRLEERGLAERRPDPDDRRVRQLGLTEEGHGLLGEISKQMHRANPLLQNLSPEDLQALREILTRAVASP